MRFGLVLGAGGVVGMNHHCGALHALAEVGGVDPADAELVVGTSAGSVIGSLLRSGWTARDCWDFALGTHPLVAGLDEEELERQRRAVLAPRHTSPFHLARLTVGSAYVVARSMGLPLPRVPQVVARHFPGGLFSMQDAEERLADILPTTWPTRPLWLVAVDLTTGRRVVLGRPGSPEVSLHDAVLASCAIPGVYPPVRAGDLTLVDGGAHSSTNLDLAARDGCDVVVCVAPMAYDPASRPHPMAQLARRTPSRAVAAEAREARGLGTQVLLLRPTAAEVVAHGRRMMRPTSGEPIARAAYEATARLLETPRFRRVLADLAAA